MASEKHKKKKAGKKADKRKVQDKKKRREAEGGKDGKEGNKKPLSKEAARKQNPKAFVFSSRGRAKQQQLRSADKDQRRMHGERSRTWEEGVVISPSPQLISSLTAPSRPDKPQNPQNNILLIYI